MDFAGKEKRRGSMMNHAAILSKTSLRLDTF